VITSLVVSGAPLVALRVAWLIVPPDLRQPVRDAFALADETISAPAGLAVEVLGQFATMPLARQALVCGYALLPGRDDRNHDRGSLLPAGGQQRSTILRGGCVWGQ
jgi:hypothetical protein